MRIPAIKIHRDPTIEELQKMLDEQHHPPRPQPTFGWTINRQTTKYGKSLIKLTEYRPDNGQKLIVVDKFLRKTNNKLIVTGFVSLFKSTARLRIVPILWIDKIGIKVIIKF